MIEVIQENATTFFDFGENFLFYLNRWQQRLRQFLLQFVGIFLSYRADCYLQYMPLRLFMVFKNVADSGFYGIAGIGSLRFVTAGSIL